MSSPVFDPDDVRNLPVLYYAKVYMGEASEPLGNGFIQQLTQWSFMAVTAEHEGEIRKERDGQPVSMTICEGYYSDESGRELSTFRRLIDKRDALFTSVPTIFSHTIADKYLARAQAIEN